MIHKNTLVFDIETDSPNPEVANLKWFGAYSYKDGKYYMYDYTQKSLIEQLIKQHKYVIGFNNKSFDQPITERYLEEEVFNPQETYKVILDLWEVLSPPGRKGFGEYNKNRLVEMNIKLENYKLKTICDYLKLDDFGKGDIDYNIFKKDNWTKEEIQEIKKYLKQDIVLTKKLFEWYEKQFRPLEKMLSEKDRRTMKHLKSRVSALAYSIICNKAGLDAKFAEDDEKPEDLKSYAGGHHIDARWKIVKGNIIEIDFASAYPHAMMMCNLYSPVETEGWDGDRYYSVQGKYNNKEKGKVEAVINHIYKERQKAKKNGEKEKDKSYKLIINSAYGLTGNWKFKNLYNPTTASDCTSIVRTWMKKLAKHLEENGFTCLYGFTDSIFVQIPEELNKEMLMFLVNKVIEEFKSHVPFPMDSFVMDIEEEIKMIWFVSKNCYLYVTKDDEVKYKSTLFNKNTPKAIMRLFEEYMKPKIISNLDIDFTKKEIENKMKEILKENPELSAEKNKVRNKETYDSKTCKQYQVAERYGSGEHFLIPNRKGIGIGKETGTKKRKPLRHCNYKEFQENKLTVENIDLKRLLQHIKPFIKKKKSPQTKLK